MQLGVPSYFQPPRYTYEDYKHWPGDWELIFGYPVSLFPSPKKKHQNFNKRFVVMVENALNNLSSSCQCEIQFELDWIINEETVVRPDSMIVCGDFNSDFLTFPPTLILEVASQSTFLKDRNIKLKLYEANNVKYYLIANPDKKSLECFELKEGVYHLKDDSNNYQLTADCNIEIDGEKLW
jgi:Uma2 family endonuclease